MRFLSDAAIHHLRAVADEPDLTGTQYRLISPLERGGMGTVYLAEDTELQRHVALKVLSTPDADGSLAARMTTEARILARLEHPGIVPVHDVGRLPDGRVFYVMKQVRGNRLDEHAASLTERFAALRIFQRVCEAVAFAHAHGVIHRDLKPQNVMVGEFGEVLVMDWGAARMLHRPEAEVSPGGAATSAMLAPGQVGRGPAAASLQPPTLHGTRIGTPGYMAPEQARGEVDRIDQRTDVYGLGALLAYILTTGAWLENGDPVGDDASPLERLDRAHRRLPRPLLAICTRACASDPADRYASAHELAADVDRFLEAQAVSAYRESTIEKTARFVSRYRTAIALVVTYMILRVLFIVFGR